MKTDQDIFIEHANLRRGLNPDGSRLSREERLRRREARKPDASSKPRTLISSLTIKRLEICDTCDNYRGNRKCKLKTGGCSSCWFKKQQSKCPAGKW